MTYQGQSTQNGFPVCWLSSPERVLPRARRQFDGLSLVTYVGYLAKLGTCSKIPVPKTRNGCISQILFVSKKNP
jgi:hypothetical protein